MLGREYLPGSRVVKDAAAVRGRVRESPPSLASWVGWVAFDGADITKVPDPGYILGSGRLALTGRAPTCWPTTCCSGDLGLDGAIAIDDDADAAREADGAAVEEKEPR